MNSSILNSAPSLQLPSSLNFFSLLSLDSEIPNLLLMLKLKNNLQAQLLRNGLSQLVDCNDHLPLAPVATQPFASLSDGQPVIPPINSKALFSQTVLKLNSRQNNLNSVDSLSGRSESSDSETEVSNDKAHLEMFSFISDNPSICLEAQIKHMVTFFINSYGKISEEKVHQERKKYATTKALAHVFDTLVVKYASTTKTKEEMVKYILRRAFKSFRKNIKKVTQMNAKGVSNELCSKYFNISKEELNGKIQSDEDLLKLLLPFRKNSKNKTMNSSFISEIFANEEFSYDYENSYLQEFDQLAEKDNKEKMKRFVSFIEECIKKESYEAIKKYKRIPWLKIWMENTKKVAFEISSQKQSEGSPKKIKRNEE